MRDDASEDTPQKALVDKAFGLLIAFGLTGLGAGGVALVEAWFERRDAAVLASIPDVLVTWREPADGAFWILLLILLSPMLLVPGAFGARRGRPEGAWRWRMVGLAAALVACGVGLQALLGRPEMGVATPFGVSWLHDGKPREYWSWGAATAVGVGCAITPRTEDGRETVPVVNYDVTFPSGREANLAREPGQPARLVARLTPIDASLRARAVPRFAAADAACLDRFGRRLPPAGQAALGRLFGPAESAPARKAS